MAFCKFAKSADKMLGMILEATVLTLVLDRIARAAVLDEQASSPASLTVHLLRELLAASE